MEIAGPTDADITGLTADSRKVESGFLFAAFEGAVVDGRDFIPDAIARGAAAILAPEGTRLEDSRDGVTLLTSALPRRDYAQMSARFWGEQPAAIAAVTGTNGKSSVADFTRQLWEQAGKAAASIGTLGLVSPKWSEAGGLTTPDAGALNQTLSSLAADGVDYLVLEASSHGLDQYRLDGVAVSIAAFTNLSRDHLDYHGSMEAYMAAKARLFADLLPADGVAVLNADELVFDQLREVAAAKGCWVLSYGRNGDDIRLVDVSALADGQKLNLVVKGEEHELLLPLIGGFQVSNALCALGVVLASGLDEDAALAGLVTLKGVRGRMELAGRQENGAAVYVDYAHTPDALGAALAALRFHTENRLHVVLGCGGDRDTGKRPEMGAVAADLADQVIVTDDNPRTEDAAAIRKEILTDSPGAKEIQDRRNAINVAVASMEAGDVLLVAGKGHEQGQIVGEDVLTFDDVQVCQEALQNSPVESGS